MTTLPRHRRCSPPSPSPRPCRQVGAAPAAGELDRRPPSMVGDVVGLVASLTAVIWLLIVAALL